MIGSHLGGCSLFRLPLDLALNLGNQFFQTLDILCHQQDFIQNVLADVLFQNLGLIHGFGFHVLLLSPLSRSRASARREVLPCISYRVLRFRGSGDGFYHLCVPHTPSASPSNELERINPLVSGRIFTFRLIKPPSPLALPLTPPFLMHKFWQRSRGRL